MEINETEKYCIITPLCPKLDSRQAGRISSEIKSRLLSRIGLDLSFVKDCTIEFIENIKNIKNLSLFNIPSDIFAILTCMNLDSQMELYASETDFVEERRKILNRRFHVIK